MKIMGQRLYRECDDGDNEDSSQELDCDVDVNVSTVSHDRT